MSNKQIYTLRLDATKNDYLELTKGKFLRIINDGNEDIWIKKDYAEILLSEFVRNLVKEGKLLPINGYNVDNPKLDLNIECDHNYFPLCAYNQNGKFICTKCNHVI